MLNASRVHKREEKKTTPNEKRPDLGSLSFTRAVPHSAIK